MLRIAAAEDLTALTRLRRAATGDSAEDAAVVICPCAYGTVSHAEGIVMLAAQH